MNLWTDSFRSSSFRERCGVIISGDFFMLTARRALVLAVIMALVLVGFGVNASADETVRSTYRPHPAQQKSVARGLIVKTMTVAPSAAMLKAADAALGSAASVADSNKLLGKISTVDFDVTIPVAVAAEAAQALSKRGDVVWAVPNTLRRTSAVSPVPSNDTLFSLQRNLWDTSTTSPVGGYSIKAPSLWRKTKGSSDVVVAVVDTGIRPEHPDLEGQLVDGYDMIGADQTNSGSTTYELAGDEDGRDPDASDPGDWTTDGQCGNYPDGAPIPGEDSSWHGTFTAGIVAAKANNGQFIAGAAPDVKVQPVRVLGHCGGWDSDIIAGLSWASGGHVDGVVDNLTPAKVVNLSLGFTEASATDRNASCVAYADAAAAGRARGAVFVAAAGNDFGDANLAVPSSCDGYVSVGTTSYKGFSATYSNIGTAVDLSAPGGDTLAEGSSDSIVSLVNSGHTVPEVGGSTYARHEGSSMAAPEVAAGAALLYSSMPGVSNDLVTANTIQTALLASVSPFRAKSSAYANKAITIDGDTYYFDLNCAGHLWCGRGTLDLSKVQASLSGPTISGTAVVGETLSAAAGTWVGGPTSFIYTWLHDGTPINGATATTYTVAPNDVDARISVRVAPATPAFRAFGGTSTATPAIPQGPALALTGLRTTARYGVAGGATVTIGTPEAPVNGVVQLRRGSTVLASGTAVAGTVNLKIPATSWLAGTNRIRAAFLGNGTDAAVSTVPQTVTVAKASSTIWHSLVASTVKRTSYAKSKVTIRVTGDTRPTGLVRVYDGTKWLKTYKMYASYNGAHTFTLPKITKRGKHSIKWIYAGNANITGKSSTVKTLTVK